MTNQYLNQVAEFHRAFRYRQPEPVAPDLSDAPTNKLRVSLLTEELHELKDAETRVDQLDALCDIQYVLSGAVLAWGYRSLVEHTRIVVELRHIRDFDAHLAAMLGLVKTMEMVAEMNFQAQMLTLLTQLQGRLMTAVHSLGFGPVFSDAFSEVHRSNMSKAWKRGEITAHLTSGNQENYTFWHNDDGTAVCKRDDGKIIKSPSYSPASLERFV